MKLSNNVKAFLLGVVAFLALDAVYLGSTSNMWNNLLIRISGEKIQMRIGYAVACYALIVFSWYYFIYLQYREHKNIKKSVITAAILGFCIYGIYELTNAAIMRKWELKFVVMDTTWGSILYSLVTYFTLSLLN
jgi:uncharacterized membrane protein